MILRKVCPYLIVIHMVLIYIGNREVTNLSNGTDEHSWEEPLIMKTVIDDFSTSLI